MERHDRSPVLRLSGDAEPTMSYCPKTEDHKHVEKTLYEWTIRHIVCSKCGYVLHKDEPFITT